MMGGGVCLVRVDPHFSEVYCSSVAPYECGACFLPLCREHSCSSPDFEHVPCPDCFNGYLQREGSSDYVKEEE